MNLYNGIKKNLKENEEINYKQKFIDYCNSKVDPKLSDYILYYNFRDSYNDTKEFKTDNYNAREIEVILLDNDGHYYGQTDIGNMDYTLVDLGKKLLPKNSREKPYLEKNGIPHVLINGWVVSPEEIIAGLDFKKISKSIYDGILEYWDDMDMDSYFSEDSDNINMNESANGYNPNPMIFSKMINLESFVGDKYNRELFNSDGIDIEVNDLVKDINKKLIGLKYNDKNEFISDLEYLKYFVKQNKEYFYDAIDLDIINAVDKVINVTKMVKDSDEIDNAFRNLENAVNDPITQYGSVGGEVRRDGLKEIANKYFNGSMSSAKEYLENLLYNDAHSENVTDDETDNIDHFIERGDTIIPVRVGETDAEVLGHLSSLGILQQVDPSDEEKASGEYIPLSSEMNDRTSLIGVKWIKNPNYVKLESGLNESEEQHADEIVVKFKNSKRDRDTYYKMLNAISELEDQNKISKEKYDSCIKQLQELYNKRDRNLKESYDEAEGINLDYNRFKNQILNFIEAEDEANFQNYDNGIPLADNICDFLAYKVKDDKLAVKLTNKILKNRKSLNYLNDGLLKEIYDKYIG